MGPLVTTQWLAENLGAPDLKILDASWYMPGDARDPVADFRASHVPGARFFDIEALSDEDNPLPHMMAPPEKFAAGMRALGVDNGDRVVVYDGDGVFSAPRAWWMLRLMGHGTVAVLDGGFPKWRREGRPVTDAATAIVPGDFAARPAPALSRDAAQVAAALRGGVQVVDARSASRFTGAEKEPRAGLRSGHMPGAKNVPWRSLLTDGAFKSPAELAALLADRHIDPARPAVTTCGSGVSAATLMIGLILAGAKDVALYDGSWAEWGGLPDAPVAEGP